MDSHHFFSFRPELKPHSYTPSEDHPTEFILILDKDGSALGISHTEKRLTERMNQNRTIGEIVQQMVSEDIAILSTLRRLLWDLDRYGFLKTSPWPISPGHAWGYWGIPLNSCAIFVSRIFPEFLEKRLGRILLSPYFGAASLVIFLFLLFKNRSLFYEERLMLIGDSVALALLVVLLSLPAGLLICNWFTTAVLKAIHPAPVRCLADYRFGIPLFRLDGRRIRALPTKKALYAAFSPILAILLLAGIGLQLAAIGEGIRRAWLFHVANAFCLSCFLMLLPVNSTVLSREIVLRLRGDSVFWTMTRAVRKTFRSFIHPEWQNAPHERLFWGWGIWSIVGTLILIRMITTFFRRDFPILLNHFLQEENSVLLILLLVITATACAFFVAAILTFFGWLIREVIREVRRRFWPHHDHVLVLIGVSSLLFFLSQIYWSSSSMPQQTHHFLVMICGGILAGTACLCRRYEKGGFEPLVTLILFFAALLLLLAGLENVWFRPQGEISSDTNVFLWLHLTIASVFLVYYVILHAVRFTRISQRSASRNEAVVITFIGFVLILSLACFPLFQQTRAGEIGRIVMISYLIVTVSLSAWRGRLRNHSFSYLICGLLLLTSGRLWNPAIGPAGAGDFLSAAGVVFALGGLCLRQSILSKTVLTRQDAISRQPLHDRWTYGDIGNEFLIVARHIYNATPQINIAADMNSEKARLFFHQLNALTGAQTLRAIFRRAAMEIPWKEIQPVCHLIPVQVAIPRLTDWTEDRILQLFKKIPTFLHIGDEINKIMRRARFAVFDANDTIIRQTEKGGLLYIIADGRVSIEHHHAFGHTVLAVFTAGNFVGEIGFLSGGERTATVRALETTLTLAIHRNEIDASMPRLQTAIREAEAGQSWLQFLKKAKVIREFPPSLGDRVGLESQHIYLDRFQTLPLETDAMANEIVVLLAGECSLLREGTSQTITAGSIAGLENLIEKTPYSGVLRAEVPSHLLLVQSHLFLEAITELLTPIQILQAEETKT
ncbi:MAG: cyclic nucleotide-binding domain-containing protein [Candidatus Omnitrophota bacterium]|jgi:CRP-like cAMP-binding protein|nr:MAG: cyclic nucleotide-binding domain-containing protein [Candidatus Omnitrophota bacterium]